MREHLDSELEEDVEAADWGRGEGQGAGLSSLAMGATVMSKTLTSAPPPKAL